MSTPALRGLARRAFWAAAAGLVLLALLAVLAVATLEVAARRAPKLSLALFEDRSALVLDADGHVLRGFLAKDGRWRLLTRPQDVPRVYLDMLLAYEDQRFFHHHGIDARALLRAALQAMWYRHTVSGASTLTMQVARLAEPRGAGLASKLHQMVVARQLERQLSKTQILTLYLTLAPFGGNIEGVRAASLAYFRKEPAALTPAEAALLVSLPQAPEARRPDRKPAAATLAWHRVVDRMLAQGMLRAADIGDGTLAPLPKREQIAFAAPHLAERLLAMSPAWPRSEPPSMAPCSDVWKP